MNITKTQMYKIVMYNKPKKKAVAKVNRINPQHNRLTVNGDPVFKANVIEIIYKSMREPDFSFESDAMLVEIKPFIRSTHKYFNVDDTTMSKEKLITEYHKHILQKEHQVYQYNLI